jgi:pseudouridine-5'-phosphate glycosidase
MVQKRISLGFSTNTSANGVTVKDYATGTANQITYWKSATQYTATVLGFEVYTNGGFGLVHNGGQTDAGLGRFTWAANAEL